MQFRILALRRSLDLTQAEFAQKTGFSLRAISAWETGERIPKNRNMEEIERFVAKALADTNKGEGVEPKGGSGDDPIINVTQGEEAMWKQKYDQKCEEFMEQSKLIIALQTELLSIAGDAKKPLGFLKKKNG